MNTVVGVRIWLAAVLIVVIVSFLFVARDEGIGAWCVFGGVVLLLLALLVLSFTTTLLD